MTNDNTNSRMNRRSFVKWAGVSGVGLASVGSASATGKGKEWDKSPLRVYVKRKEGKKYLYVKNVSKRTVQVRDIDSAGVDFITGRPELKSGETKKFRAKKKGKYVLRAYSPRTGKPLGKRIVKEIKRRKDGDGRKDGRHKDGKKDDRHKKKRDRYDGDKKDDREDEKDDEKKRKRGRWH